MRQTMIRKASVAMTAFVVALGGAAIAQASGGSDDPVGDDHGVLVEPGDDNGGAFEAGDDNGTDATTGHRHRGHDRSHGADDGRHHHRHHHHRHHHNDDGPNHT